MHPKRYLIVLLGVAAFNSSGAMASDLQCATTQQPAERVICDHAILNNEYDDIFAQQQALLGAGKLSPEQIAQWRQSRNACTDVHCIDVAFAQWKAMTQTQAAGGIAPAAQAPAIASSTELAPVGPAPDAIPSVTSEAIATSQASLVHQGSAAGVALPQPVAPEAASSASAAAASSPADSRSTSGVGIGLIVALLAVAAAGVLFVLRKRKSDGR